jgi:(p)ppGpp synthase/HD superfamily hydrolase
MSPISLTALERRVYPSVPALVLGLTNVEQTDPRTWNVTLTVSDEIMRELCHAASDPVRISLVPVGDRLELMATRA